MPHQTSKEVVRDLLVRELSEGRKFLGELVRVREEQPLATECPKGCSSVGMVQDAKFCINCGTGLVLPMGQVCAARVERGKATVRAHATHAPVCSLDGHRRVQRTARGVVVRDGKRFCFLRICEVCAEGVEGARGELERSGAKPALLKALVVFSRKQGIERATALNNPPARKRPAKPVASAAKETVQMMTLDPNGNGTPNDGNGNTAPVTEPETSTTPTAEVPAVATAEAPVTPIPGAPEPRGRRIDGKTALRHAARRREDDIGRQIENEARQADFAGMVEGFVAFLQREKGSKKAVQFVDGDGCNLEHVLHEEYDGTLRVGNALVLGTRLVRLCSRATKAFYEARTRLKLADREGMRPLPLKVAEGRVEERREFNRVVQFHKDAGRQGPWPVTRDTCGIDHKGCGPVIRFCAVPDAQAHQGRVVGFCEMACEAFVDAGNDGTVLLTADKAEAQKRAEAITVAAPWVRKGGRNDDRRPARKEFSLDEKLAFQEDKFATLEVAEKDLAVHTTEYHKQKGLLKLLRERVGAEARANAPVSVVPGEATKPTRDPSADKARDTAKVDAAEGDDDGARQAALATARATKGGKGGGGGKGGAKGSGKKGDGASAAPKPKTHEEKLNEALTTGRGLENFVISPADAERIRRSMSS